MVGVDRRNGRDRAQLVLVGSIAIAFVVLGLVVVFNTVLFTENIAARGSVEDVEGADEFQQQVEAEVPRLVRGVENGTDSNADFVSDVDENVSVTYSRLLAETYADSGTAYVDVSFDADNSTYGTHVVQNDNSTFENASGAVDWDPVNTNRNVTEFRTAVVVSELTTVGSTNDNFSVEMVGDSGDRVTVVFSKSTTGDDLVLTQYRNGGALPDDTCTITDSDYAGGTARVNLSTGTSPDDGSCSFDGLDSLDAPYTLRFDNATRVKGNYTFFASGRIATPAGGKFNDRNGPSPSATQLVLGANLDLTYETSAVSYESNQTVTVREGAP